MRLYEEDVENPSDLFQVDISRIRKCRVSFSDPRQGRYLGLRVSSFLTAFVRRLSQGHQIQHFLADLSSVDKQIYVTTVDKLALCFRSIRNIKICHFEVCGKGQEPGLRLLSRLIMSDDLASVRETRYFRKLAEFQSWAEKIPWMQDDITETMEEVEKAHEARIRELYTALRIPYMPRPEEKI